MKNRLFYIITSSTHFANMAEIKEPTAQRVMRVDKLFEIADALMVTPTELCPKRYVDEEKIDSRLSQLGEKLKKMDAGKRAAVYQAMEALVNGFLQME